MQKKHPELVRLFSLTCYCTLFCFIIIFIFNVALEETITDSDYSLIRLFMLIF